MDRLTDSELMDEIRKRFDEHKKSLHDLRVVTRKLEDVNDRLNESEALKSNFLSNIRNEINNPLSSLLALSSELKSGSCDTVSSIAGTLYTELFSLDFQIRNIIMAAEIEAGETDLGIAGVDIDALIRSTIDSFSHKADEKGLSVSYTFIDEPGDKRPFRTDPTKFQLAFSNLFSNAVEFSREKGQVVVKAWRNDGHLNVFVEDFGVGIDESEIGIIFDRFRQLDAGISKKHKGHGLGLSVTKAMVDLLGGTISVVCKKEKGCIFTLFLPMAKGGEEMETLSADGNEFFFEDGEKF